jgi:hypothetical protein
MRTLLKIFVTALVLAGAFVAYVVFQPVSVRQSAATSRPSAQPLTRSGSNSLIGEGQNAWVRQFDEEGRLASRFRAEKWEPEKGGLVRVTRPEAELYLKGGKDKDGKDKPRPRVTIRGDDGEVVVQGLPEASSADKPLAPMQGNLAPGGGGAMGPTQPPSSGRLNGVVIEVFETESATEPVATLRTNNIVFDNETFRISTESYTAADGTTVAPDEVPVSVQGPYFDFYGRGMTVRWNDLEERLDLLRIARGERLVIKKVDAFPGAGGLPLGAPGHARPAEPPTSALGAPPPSNALASADPTAAFALAAADKARPRRAAPPQNTTTTPAHRRVRAGDLDKGEPTYRAAFEDDVRILQGEQQLATARLMNVDFLLGQRKPDPATTRPAASQPSSQATSPPASQPATAPADQAAQSAATTKPFPQTQPATTPTTSPEFEPVTVYWTGELNVTPLGVPPTTPPATAPSTAPTTAPSAASSTATASADGPLPPGEARVELVGAPAVLTRDLLEVRTARFIYRTDNRLWLDKSDEFPRVLITQESARQGGAPTTISTEGLTYARADQLATLRGDSRVTAPIESNGARPADDPANPDLLDASWNELAAFRLVGQTEHDLWVEHATFTGDVNVKAPQGNVRARQLELAFDPPAPPATSRDPEPGADDTPPESPPDAPRSSQPNLRHVLATDNVFCELIDAKEGPRRVECQRLALDTARSDAGQLYPEVIDATGGVRAATADQELSAGHVLLHLRPAKKQPPAPDDARAEAADDVAPGPADPARAAQAAVELESMTATDAVRVASRDGGVATGKRLEVTVDEDGAAHVALSGDPAQVQDGRNGTLTGPRILVDPKTGMARVPGPGTLRAVQRDATDDPADPSSGRPTDLTWADGADVRGGEDRIEITGAVSLWLTDTDGSVRSANAGRVVIELAARPADAQAAQPQADAGADAPADARSAPDRSGAAGPPTPPHAGALNTEQLKDKEVAKIHQQDNAAGNSRLAAADGTLLRQFHLKAQTITYDVRARQLTVPGPGQMLVESHDATPAGGEANAAAGQERPDAAMRAGGSGVTAFGWAGGMEYDQATGRAAMDGSVVVTHQPDARAGGKPQPPIRLDADRLVAGFDVQHDGQETGQAPGRGAGPDDAQHARAQALAGDDVKMQLRSVQAEGNILIVREGAELHARRIDNNPDDEWVVARGTDRAPATFTDPSGAGTVRAGELWLNTRTWGVKVKDVSTRVGGGRR